MGATYRDAVLRCIRGVEEGGIDDVADVDRKKKDLMGFYWGVVRELAKCHCK
jgi:hypothetical protein